MNPVDYQFRARPKKRKVSLKIETRKTIRSLIITLTIMISVLAIAYLFMTAQNAQMGYELEQLRQESKYLQDENTKWTNKITEATAFSSLEEEEKTGEMEALDVDDYVTED